MTTQEKINQLTKAALSVAPPSASAPRPVTFSPSIEQLRMPTHSVEIPTVVGNEMPVFQTPVTAEHDLAEVAEKSVEISSHQTDPVLGAVLEEQGKRLKKKQIRQRIFANLTILLALAGGGIWYANSPKAQAQVKSLVPALRQSGKDVHTLTHLLGTFDKQLEKIGTHGSAVDEASRSMGVDPTKVASTEDPDMNKEMDEFTHGEGKTTSQRNQMLKSKFGFVAKLAGDNAKLGQGHKEPH